MAGADAVPARARTHSSAVAAPRGCAGAYAGTHAAAHAAAHAGECTAVLFAQGVGPSIPVSQCPQAVFQYPSILGRPNFGGHVLGCIEAKFCVQILILQLFSRSTKWSSLILQNFAKFQKIS